MNTSHHDGGAPDVFLKNASDATLRDLKTLELATQAIKMSIACLYNPDLGESEGEFWQDNHDEWHRYWCQASTRLMKTGGRLSTIAIARHHQLEMEGLK